MVSVIVTDPQPISAVKRLLARCTYTLIPLSILLSKYYSIGRSYNYWAGETTYIGVTDDKNALGALCLLLGIASGWRLLNLINDRRTSARKRHITINLVSLAMIVFLLVLSRSATSLSCAALVTCVLVAIRLRMFIRSKTLVHCLAGSVVLVPLLAIFGGMFPGVFEALGRNATLTDRTLIWSWVIKLVPNQWIGAGFASFWLGTRLDVMIANVTHVWVPNQAHNGYLEVFANLGWVGVGLLGLVIVWGYFELIDGLCRRRLASDLMLAYFIAALISNLTEASFLRPLVPTWLFFLLAVTLPALPLREQSQQLLSSRKSYKTREVQGHSAAWSGAATVIHPATSGER